MQKERNKEESPVLDDTGGAVQRSDMRSGDLSTAPSGPGGRGRRLPLVRSGTCVLKLPDKLQLHQKEVLVDNLLPAAVAASCSSQQWEKEPGRRVQGGGQSAGEPGRQVLTPAGLCSGNKGDTVGRGCVYTNTEGYDHDDDDDDDVNEDEDEGQQLDTFLELN
ncbi:unnamed protein product [Pleuronectes platessa]|uniref:Uncharacterized protein n=1 Tax=Pleuronectes platessa TaxID=8262 RepID=A0A9N7Z7L3_PLEPL|nr:unnamed protein product [Pleuronectes platessa]